MAKNIDPQPSTIGNYLKISRGTVFVIPEYQRAYSWTTENCDKLWQDILDYSEADSNDSYFFGTVIVNCQDNDTRLVLIDGLCGKLAEERGFAGTRRTRENCQAGVEQPHDFFIDVVDTNSNALNV